MSSRVLLLMFEGTGTALIVVLDDAVAAGFSADKVNGPGVVGF